MSMSSSSRPGQGYEQMAAEERSLRDTYTYKPPRLLDRQALLDRQGEHEDGALRGVEDVKTFAQSIFGAGNVAILGTGIEAGGRTRGAPPEVALQFSSSASPPSTPSSYFGDESRIGAHHGPKTVFVGFGTAGPPAQTCPLGSYVDCTS
ncbi:hypothetical protein L226DRAFT_611638 [Lentinus tigrinus ALCF2SS1-7]|uniref:uncharacterized protein n=1 Tax=Lentinus tigrinus ALCF2SS1-7 TaxID=1328758 RepID=UPI001165F39F|nr:hypothetical protein L226DRAFT_611638 [Lentinus tigrinus ALCF2SS1-7]